VRLPYLRIAVIWVNHDKQCIRDSETQELQEQTNEHNMCRIRKTRDRTIPSETATGRRRLRGLPLGTSGPGGSKCRSQDWSSAECSSAMRVTAEALGRDDLRGAISDSSEDAAANTMEEGWDDRACDAAAESTNILCPISGWTDRLGMGQIMP